MAWIWDWAFAHQVPLAVSLKPDGPFGSPALAVFLKRAVDLFLSYRLPKHFRVPELGAAGFAHLGESIHQNDRRQGPSTIRI